MTPEGRTLPDPAFSKNGRMTSKLNGENQLAFSTIGRYVESVLIALLCMHGALFEGP